MDGDVVVVAEGITSATLKPPNPPPANQLLIRLGDGVSCVVLGLVVPEAPAPPAPTPPKEPPIIPGP